MKKDYSRGLEHIQREETRILEALKGSKLDGFNVAFPCTSSSRTTKNGFLRCLN